MSIIVNGTEIGAVNFNNTEINTVNFNGVEVFSGSTPLSYFTFTKIESKNAYEIKAKDPKTMPTVIKLPKKYNGLPITAISVFGFKDCTSSTSIEISSSITTINDSAFQNMGITSITIPSTVTEITSGICYNCKKLVSVKFENNVNLTQIPGLAFFGCSSLKEFIIPPFITSLSFSCFRYCDGLTHIEIPNSVSELLGFNFQYCTNLSTVDIGTGIKKIGNQVFASCTALQSLTCRATTPPTLGNSVFNGVPSNCEILVPSSSVEAYKAAAGWSDRAEYITAIPE